MISRKLHSKIISRFLSAKAPFPGAPNSEYTQQLKFENKWPVIPTFRVIDRDGRVLSPTQEPKLDEKVLLKMYQSMVTLNTMDFIMYEAQRQGRISFYMTSYGEEAIHMGSAAALKPEDVVFGYLLILIKAISRSWRVIIQGLYSRRIYESNVL